MALTKSLNVATVKFAEMIGWEKVVDLALSAGLNEKILATPAVALGATTIERHITLDRAMYGNDQAASLEPEGIKRLVRDIRLIDKIMGNGIKTIWKSEIPAQKKLRQIFT